MTLVVDTLVLGVNSRCEESTEGLKTGGMFRVRAILRRPTPLTNGSTQRISGLDLLPILPVLAVFCYVFKEYSL